MKATGILWAVIFLLSFLTAGFIPAILITGLAAGASVTAGLSAQNNFKQIDPVVAKKMLGR